MHACIHRFIHTHIIVSNISIWLPWNVMDVNFNICIYIYNYIYIYKITHIYIYIYIHTCKIIKWTNDGWKILHIAWSLRALSCRVPVFPKNSHPFPRWKKCHDFLLFRLEKNMLKHAETLGKPLGFLMGFPRILLMYHVVACIFFGLGKLNESQVSWIQTYGGAAQFFFLRWDGLQVWWCSQ